MKRKEYKETAKLEQKTHTHTQKVRKLVCYTCEDVILTDIDLLEAPRP